VSLTNDLEIQGYIILHMTLPISTTAHAKTPNLLLCIMFYKSFRVLPNVWPWRMTWTSKVTLFCTCPYLYQLLHMLKHRFLFLFCFVSQIIYSVVRYFIPDTAKCVTLKGDVEIQGLIILHVYYVSDNSFRVLPNVW